MLQVLCTTSTLAMGVNLPARLVVLKGTRRYVGSEAEDASGYQEYERSTCLQARHTIGKRWVGLQGLRAALCCVEVLQLASNALTIARAHTCLCSSSLPKLDVPCLLCFADGWPCGPPTV